MYKSINTFIIILYFISFTYSTEIDTKTTNLFQIDPNDQSSFPKEEISEVEKISNEKTQEIIAAGLIGEVTKVDCWTNRPVWPQGVPSPTGKFEVPKELNWDLWIGPAKADHISVRVSKCRCYTGKVGAQHN